MSTPTPPASTAEASRPPGSLPWEWAARELALAPASAADTIRRACEQWARSATKHWRQHNAETHTTIKTLRAQLALCRDVLTFADTVIEECRPLVKGRLGMLYDEGKVQVDDSILDRIAEAQTRIEQALKVGL